MFRASDCAPWMTPREYILGMSYQEKAPGQTQDLDELEEVTRMREVWASLLKLLPLQPEPVQGLENGWKDVLS